MLIKKDLYDILGVAKNSSDDEIKKAYKKAALKYHPDRNRDNQEEANTKFQEINKAFQTLSNPDKRRNYDQFGVIDGENNDNMPGGPGMPSGFPFDIFGNIFGGGFGGPGMQPGSRNTKSPDKKITINITLTDVYLGKSIPLDFTKIICCDLCHGSGSNKPDGIKTCNTCNGKGRIVRMMQMGPMIQQSVHPCNTCGGVGKGIAPGCECTKCKGKKGIQIKSHVDCYVRPGSQQGTTITFKNESDWQPDFTDIGDLIVYVNCSNEQSIFRREGENLIMKKSISLLEALTGFEFRFKHLDDRVLNIKYENIIQPGQQMIIRKEGMPHLQDNLEKGDLIIIFTIVFPNTLEKERSKYLVKILPPPLKKQIWDLQNDAIPDNQVVNVQIEPYDNDNKYSNDNMKKQNYNTNTNTNTNNNTNNYNNTINLDDNFDNLDDDEHNETFKKFYNGATAGMPECTTQ